MPVEDHPPERCTAETECRLCTEIIDTESVDGLLRVHHICGWCPGAEGAKCLKLGTHAFSEADAEERCWYSETECAADVTGALLATYVGILVTVSVLVCLGCVAGLLWRIYKDIRRTRERLRER